MNEHLLDGIGYAYMVNATNFMGVWPNLAVDWDMHVGDTTKIRELNRT